MKSLNHSLLLFAVILIEGYIVLSSELLAIRQTIPFVGSGTDTVSIIIAAVLMPLAFGYHYGGNFKRKKLFGHYITVRKKLILNILIAATFLLFGLSYRFISYFFSFLFSLGLTDRLVNISIYSVIFLVIPVFLLGQTVPLITNFFSRERLSQLTGRILFFSTVGSFLGAIISTLALMPFIGVHNTVSLNFILLTVLVLLLKKPRKYIAATYIVLITLLALGANSNIIIRSMGIVKNNEYNTISVKNLRNGDRILMMNGNYSSKLNDQGNKFPYIEFAEDIAIYPTFLDEIPPKDFLIIGAGGFTIGNDDEKNNYTFVDIDKDLLEISEKYILEHPLSANKKFVAQPARAFLASTDKKFDFIYLDAYTGGVSIPEHLITQEFFMEVKNHLNPNGIVITNFVLSANFEDEMSRNVDTTFRSVFPHVSRVAIDGNYNLNNTSGTAMLSNISYIYRNDVNDDTQSIYTDDKNSVFYDKPKIR